MEGEVPGVTEEARSDLEIQCCTLYPAMRLATPPLPHTCHVPPHPSQFTHPTPPSPSPRASRSATPQLTAAGATGTRRPPDRATPRERKGP